MRAQRVWRAQSCSGQLTFLRAGYAVAVSLLTGLLFWGSGRIRVPRRAGGPLLLSSIPNSYCPFSLTQATDEIAPALCTADVPLGSECSSCLNLEPTAAAAPRGWGMAFGAFLFYCWFSSLEFDFRILICIIWGCCEMYPEPSFELCSLEGLYSD